jgi:hypothetical protein
MKNKRMNRPLLERLTQADVVCKDCGEKYGKYSVGCSSTWMGTCDVCGEEKGITEVRDWGYLTKGINELNAQRPAQPFSELTKDFTPERKARIKEQSAKVANYMLTQEPIMTDEDLDDALTASYEQGEITLKLTEEEVGFLNECLDVIVDNHESLCPGHSNECPEDIALFESIEKKITDLYQDHCVKYSPSPAIVEYNKKYGTWGIGEDAERWEKFKDNYDMLLELGFIT